jgi:hypothetical protein
MKTLFFTWEKVEDNWIAQDPTHSNRKWVISPSAGRCPYRRWVLSYYYDNYPSNVDSDDNVEYLAWSAVFRKIREVNDCVYQLASESPEKDLESYKKFLQTLSLGDSDATHLAPNSVGTQDLDHKVQEGDSANQSSGREGV